MLGAIDKTGILERTLEAVSAIVAQVTPTAEVHGRVKTVASTAYKNRGRQVPSLDGLGLRIIVDDVADCYLIVRQIHARFDVLDGEFDDYIMRPKANGYRSLHTTILTRDWHPVEIQVRTASMHTMAERGTAAHWLYKQRAGAGKTSSG